MVEKKKGRGEGEREDRKEVGMGGTDKGKEQRWEGKTEG